MDTLIHGIPLSEQELKKLALQLRRDIIETTYFSGTGSSHVGGELSCTEIVAVLYGYALHLRPQEPNWPERDIFILSKGHCSVTLYAAMAWRGFFPRERLFTDFNRYGKNLQEHCNMYLEGIESSTGSLGMGLPNACGYAWAAKLDKMQKHIYCLLGDGECTEGQTWEGIALAAQLKLDNLIVLVDANKYVINATTAEVMDFEPFENKWRDFRWHVQRVDGHNVAALTQAIDLARDPNTAPGQPRVIICDTIKGKGISFMEKDPISWHSGHLDETLYKTCMEELDNG